MGQVAEGKRILSCQFSHEEHQLLKQIAAREGVSMSDLIREAVYRKYISPDQPAAESADLLKTALGIGYQTALQFIEERTAETLEELAAESQSKYGKVEVKIRTKKRGGGTRKKLA